MIKYSEVLEAIRTALTARPSGQKVLVEAHEAAETMLLDYIEQQVGSLVNQPIREGHVYTTGNEPIELIWNIPFESTDYSFVINGFGAEGTPVEIIFLKKSNVGIQIKTFENSEVMAIALPFFTK